MFNKIIAQSISNALIASLLRDVMSALDRAGIPIRFPSLAEAGFKLSIPPDKLEDAKLIILAIAEKNEKYEPGSGAFKVSPEWLYKPAGWKDIVTIYDAPQVTVTFSFRGKKGGQKGSGNARQWK